MPINSLKDLIAKCKEQTSLYSKRQPYDPGACYELWRRAIVDRDDLAWSALIEQYSSFVRKWIQQRLPLNGGLYYEEEALLNGVFINMFRFLTPEKFERFPTLPAILQYLKLCCGTVVADALRDMQARRLDFSLDSVKAQDHETGGNPGNQLSPIEWLGSDFELEQTVLDSLDRAEFWNSIWSILEDSTDRFLVYLHYIQRIPPRDITKSYPQFFPTIEDVRRRQKNLMWRIKKKYQRSMA